MRSFLRIALFMLVVALVVGCGSSAASGKKKDGFAAASFGDVASLESWIQGGHSVNEKSTVGSYTPLHLACSYGQSDTVRWLVEHGADVNAKGEGDMTPLHKAVQSGKADIVRYLIENHADCRATTTYGLSVLQYAESLGEPAVIEAVKEGLAKG